MSSKTDLPRTAPSRAWLASDTEVPIDLLERLAADPEAEVRLEVARNPATPLAVLETLASDPEPLVRVHAVDDGAAFSNDRRAELWNRLLKDPDWRTRGLIAVAPGLPAGLLARLAEDPDQDVRRAVAECDRPDLDPQIMERLGRDPAPEVRARIARHPNFPPTLAAALADDADPDVRAAVLEAQRPAKPGCGSLPADPAERDGQPPHNGADLDTLPF